MRRTFLFLGGALIVASFALVGAGRAFTTETTDATGTACLKPAPREMTPPLVPLHTSVNVPDGQNPTTFYLMGANFRPLADQCPGMNVQTAAVRFYNQSSAVAAEPIFTYAFPEGDVTGGDWSDSMFRLWVKNLPPTIVPGMYKVTVVTAAGESAPISVEFTYGDQVRPTATPTKMPAVTPTPTTVMSCVPRPTCLDALGGVRCLVPEPVEGWCTGTCTKRPACLTANPPCMMAEPVGGWCEYESPVSCAQVYAPVCGIDGRTYPSSCYAAAAQVKILYTGECGVCEMVGGTTLCPDPGTGYTYDRTLLSGTAGSTGDPCWCGRIVPVRPAGSTPTPTPTRAAVAPTPTPFPCTNTAGYASSCWTDGSDRVIRIAPPPAGTANGIPFSIVVTLPPAARYNAIWNQAYYWSEGRKSWSPVRLTGKTYPGASFDTAGQGYLTGSAGASVTVTPQDALDGLIYVVTWDYIYQNNDWVDPPCAAGSPSGSRCWRVATIPVPVSQ